MPEDPINEAPPATEEVTTTTVVTPPPAPELPDPESTELLEDIKNLGLNRAQLQQLIAKGQSLDNISYNLANNPRAIADMIRQVAPQTYTKLRSMMTDDFIEQHADDDGESSGEGKPRGQSSSKADSALERRLAALEQNQQQYAQYNQTVQIRSDYDKRVTAAIETVSKQRETAGQPLTPRDKKSLTALLNASYAEDPIASQRARQGIFVDMGRHLKKVLEDWDGDVVTTSKAQAEAREKVEARAGKTVAAAAQTSSTTVTPKSLEEDWDLGGEDFAKALRAGKK